MPTTTMTVTMLRTWSAASQYPYSCTGEPDQKITRRRGPEQEDQSKRTRGTGTGEQDHRNRTRRRGPEEQDHRNMTTGTGLEQEGQKKRTRRRGPEEEDHKKRTTRRGPEEEDQKKRTTIRGPEGEEQKKRTTRNRTKRTGSRCSSLPDEATNILMGMLPEIKLKIVTEVGKAHHMHFARRRQQRSRRYPRARQYYASTPPLPLTHPQPC